MKLRSLAGTFALLVGASIVSASTVVGVSPANAATGCYPPTYDTNHKIMTANRTPVVTHALTKVLSPGSSWSRTVTVEKINYVEASVEAYAEASAGAGVVLAKAEVKAGVSLKAAGSHTAKTSYSDRISIRNSTRANREYVVFNGTIKHYGTYRVRSCPYSTYQVHTKYGKWKSWTVRTSGTIRCDLGAPNRVALKAKRMYCG